MIHWLFRARILFRSPRDCDCDCDGEIGERPFGRERVWETARMDGGCHDDAMRPSVVDARDR